MPIKVLMPALSPTMTEGKLASWQMSVGDTVNAGDVLAEIETDKATMEVEAVEEGKLAKILVEAGTENVAVNTPIALLLEEGEDESALEGADASPTAAPAASDAPKAAPEAGAEPAAEPAGQPAAETKAPPAPKSGDGGRVFASPLARRIAEQRGIDLRTLTGSGPNGRIVKADVETAKAAPAKTEPTAAAPATTPQTAGTAPAPSGPGAKQLADMLGMDYDLEPLSGMRKTIAKRLTESKQTVPHFYLTVDCEIDGLLALRKELNAKAGEDGVKLSVNDLIIKAVAVGLKRVPAANASYDPEGLLYYKDADISVAVATPAGLITPIIKAAQNKGLSQISSEMKDLAARARDNKLKPEEYQGGTFSVSNLGMFGIKDFAAVINPPQGCILSVGACVLRPVVKDGALAVATVMSVTLSVDHRVVDGAVGAEFLAAFKKLIEDPMTMLL